MDFGKFQKMSAFQKMAHTPSGFTRGLRNRQVPTASTRRAGGPCRLVLGTIFMPSRFFQKVFQKMTRIPKNENRSKKHSKKYHFLDFLEFGIRWQNRRLGGSRQLGIAWLGISGHARHPINAFLEFFESQYVFGNSSK